MRSSLPTSHGFVTRSATQARTVLPPGTNSDYVNQFEFIGTIDNTNYLVVAECIKWREKVCGGEKAIMEYNTNLAREGGKAVAKILGTRILDNNTQTLTNCCLVNVLLPLTNSPSEIPGTNTVKAEHEGTAVLWMQKALIDDHKTFIAIYPFQGQYWARLSGQIYLEMPDFELIGSILKSICERVGKEEFLPS
jgi:selenocysteine lyase/cysteine desulfurase